MGRKQLYGYFKRQISGIAYDLDITKKGTESFQIAVQ